MPLRPIYVFFAKQFPGDACNNNTATQDPDYQQAEQSVQLAAQEMGLGPDDGRAFAWCVTGDEVDDQLKLGSFQLPQLLFATPDPNSTDPNALFFLAKLVQGQITRGNIKVMLQTVRQLQPKLDPSGKISFYDPSFRLLDGIGVSNSAGAPGSGGLIGLNPFSEALEVNRYGQILGNLLPFALVGLALLLVTRKRKKDRA